MDYNTTKRLSQAVNSVVFMQLVVVISADKVGSGNGNNSEPQCKLNINKQGDMNVI
jgi:hypothetical protein